MNKRQQSLVEQDFYAVLLQIQLTGIHVDEAIASLTKVSKPTWYRRKAKHPDLYQSAADRAATTSIALRQGMQVQVLQQRVTAELQAQTAIAQNTVEMVNRVIDIALDEGTLPQHAVAAARTISGWGKEGVVVPLATEETVKQAEEMGYDPNIGIDPSMLSLPPGTTMMIQTPEVVDVPIGTVSSQDLATPPSDT